jgi:lysophospholipase L1-like esterase
VRGRVAILVAFLVMTGCGRSRESQPDESTVRSNFLALGDSYTIGEGVAPSERWPVRLAKVLRERDVKVDDPQVIARTGWTTDELSAAMDAAKIDGQTFELVTLLIGVNNQYRGRSVDEYRTQFDVLLKRAIALAGNRPTRVVVLSIPDWGVTPFAASNGRDGARVGREIDAFNAVNRELTLAAGARYVDVTPVSRGASTQPAALLAADGLHPSGTMYAHWAELALGQAEQGMRSK